MRNDDNKTNLQVYRQTYTVPEIAKILGIGLNAAYALSRSVGFPTVKIGRKIIIPKQRFENWLNDVEN